LHAVESDEFGDRSFGYGDAPFAKAGCVGVELELDALDLNESVASRIDPIEVPVVYYEAADGRNTLVR
jgi:hypothetical protein